MILSCVENLNTFYSYENIKKDIHSYAFSWNEYEECDFTFILEFLQKCVKKEYI